MARVPARSSGWPSPPKMHPGAAMSLSHRAALAACALALFPIAVCWAGSALASSRVPAGGAFMNSYTSDPYFDPTSLWSQTHSVGDIGGQIMLAEPPGSPKPCALFDDACARAFERTRHHAY